MKKFFTILMLGAVLVACNRKEEPEVIEQPETPVTYTLVIKASKGDDTSTRALSLDGKTLNAYWSGKETIEVYQSGVKIGTATAAASPNGNTTVTATLTSAPNPSNDLNFYLGGYDVTYTGQNGLLTGTNSISEKYDYVESLIYSGAYTVKGYDVIPGEYTTLNFTDGITKQAIIKFTLKNSDGSALPSNPSALTVRDGTSTVSLTSIPAATYTANGSGVLYVAFPATGLTETITLNATVGEDTYIYEKSGVTFEKGKYYDISVKMYPPVVNLSSVSANYTAKNGQTLTGGLSNNVKVSIAAGATVTLDNITINGTNDSKYNWAGITCLGDATIILKDGTTNTVKGFYEDYPGIHVPAGSTLTIKGETAGTGRLDASSNDDTNNSGAGIGGGWNLACGNIVIQGGVITATGSTSAAGIGSNNQACGDITISGGTVTATGTGYAAGIGGGFNGGCGNITIASTVTRVTAIAGLGATHSIGIGREGSIGSITIGGVVIGPISTSPYVYPTPATGFALSASTVGMIVGSDGLAYNVADKNNLPPGVTAVAMVAYKNGSNGLAIQLNASPSIMDYDTASSYTGYPAVSGGVATWRLPSKDDWQNMFVGCAKSGDADKDNYMNPIAGFKEKINATGVEFYSNGYWSPDGSSSWAVDVCLEDTDAFAYFSLTQLSYYTKYVLGCLAF